MRQPAAEIDCEAAARARWRQSQLTKPRGSLGRFEDLAVILAGLQGVERPRVENVRVAIFAADHGIAAHGVSAYPQCVTRQMVGNFAAGGAAVNVLAAGTGATLEVIDVGTLNAGEPPPGVIVNRCGPGTADFRTCAAMTERQLESALNAGRAAVGRARAAGSELFIGGDMGIGNTTSAAALACALLGAPAEALAGPGSGLSTAGVRRKAAVIARALTVHRDHLDDPLEALRRLGGFEIAALAGAFSACAQQRVPVLVDGFITGVAALIAVRLCPGSGKWMLHAHRSAEPGHRRVLDALGARPLLDLGFRLGEGSGALAALPLLRLACSLHAEMATFAQAGVAAAGG
ncbi:MAG TPA: nicotinate-nucleotide--dimethylbenzimidazole phosphoribosyltransferase [Woeseiaceae bacterium]|nr:nicotinate-nucleotide--dimethylbenzimidazole phosphoribosyltransferase [Woeseiaceae bacterium]